MKTSKTKYKKKFSTGGDSTQQTPAKGGAMKGAANAIPYVSMFKQLGEGIDNAVAKKDEYGVRQGSDFAVGVGGFFNPRDATQSAINDIFKEKKFDKDTALNLAAPFLGIVKANKEKRAARDAMLMEQQFNTQTQEAQARDSARNAQDILDNSIASTGVSTPSFASTQKTLTAKTGGNLNPSIYRTGGSKGRYDLIDFKGPLHEEGGIKLMKRGGDTIEVEGGEKMIGNTILSDSIKYTDNMIKFLNSQGIKIDPSAKGKTQAEYAKALDRKKLKVNDTFSKNTEQLMNQPGRGGNADLERASDILGKIFNPDAEGYDPANEQLGRQLLSKSKYDLGGRLNPSKVNRLDDEHNPYLYLQKSLQFANEFKKGGTPPPEEADTKVNLTEEDVLNRSKLRAAQAILTEELAKKNTKYPLKKYLYNLNTNPNFKNSELKTYADDYIKIYGDNYLEADEVEKIYPGYYDLEAKVNPLQEKFNINTTGSKEQSDINKRFGLMKAGMAISVPKGQAKNAYLQKLIDSGETFKSGGTLTFPEGGKTTTDYYHTNDKGIIDAGPYAGLTVAEAREMNKLQRSDLAKSKKAAQAKYVEDYTRAGMNKAGHTVYEAAKLAGSFTPMGPLIGALDAYEAFSKGDTAGGVLAAGAEALPYGLKYVGKGVKALAKGLSKAKATDEVVEQVAEAIPTQQVDEYETLRGKMYDWAKEHGKYRGIEGAEDLLKTRVDEYIDLSKKTESKEAKNLLNILSGEDLTDLYKKDFSVLTEHNPLSVLRIKTQYPGYKYGGTRKFQLNGTTGDPVKYETITNDPNFHYFKPGEDTTGWEPTEVIGGEQREGWSWYKKQNANNNVSTAVFNPDIDKAFKWAKEHNIKEGSDFKWTNAEGKEYNLNYSFNDDIGKTNQTNINSYAGMPTLMPRIEPLQAKVQNSVKMDNTLSNMDLNIPKGSTVQEGLNEKKSQERQPYNWLAGIAGLANTALSGIANLRDVKKRKVAAQEYRAKMEELNRVPFDIQMANLSNAAQESSQTSGNYLSNMLAGTSAIANAQSQAYQNILSRNVDRQNRASEINMDARTKADYYNVGEDARVDAIKREGLQHFMQDTAGNIGSVIKNLDAQNQEASRVATMNQMYPDHQVNYKRSRWGAPEYTLKENNPYGDTQTTTNVNNTTPIINNTVQGNKLRPPVDKADTLYGSAQSDFNTLTNLNNVTNGTLGKPSFSGKADTVNLQKERQQDINNRIMLDMNDYGLGIFNNPFNKYMCGGKLKKNMKCGGTLKPKK